MRNSLILLVTFLALCTGGCSVSKSYNADKKYPKEVLQQDYKLLQKILQSKHPALYWYTPKDSMDLYFKQGYEKIADSMTELQFGWNIIAPLLSNVHCGHTSFNMSKDWYRFIRNKRIPSFPLFMKVWNDTMVVTGNLNKRDAIFKTGTVVTSINGISSKDMLHHIFSYMSEDGYEKNFNNLRLSTGFPFYHRNVYGLYNKYTVGYIDSLGNNKSTIVPLYIPPQDTATHKRDSLKKRVQLPRPKRISRHDRLKSLHTLIINKKENTATMDLYTFSKSHLKHFFRKSFRTLRQQHINNLILDIRGNGGGDISNSVLLTRFIRNTNFKVADSCFAVTKSLAPYTKYIKSGFLTNIGLRFLTHRNGSIYPFGYWERHDFKPRAANHFNGNVYVLTNGFTFSASSLFCNTVKGQQNVKIIGENTGGGWYGNSGILIPDITLPNTKLRVRLPLFRIVQFNHIATKGTGVIPDIRVNPTIQSIKSGTDLKIETARKLINSNIQ